MHSRGARCPSDQRPVRQRKGFLTRKTRRPILVALAIAAITLPSIGDASAQFRGGFGGGGFGGGGFGRSGGGGGFGGGMGGRMNMPRGGGGGDFAGPGNAVRMRPNIGRVQGPRREGVTTTSNRIAKPPKAEGSTGPKGEGMNRPPKGCRSGDCKPKDPGRKPPRNPDWPGDVVGKPPKHRPPYVPPTRIVEDVAGPQIIQRSSRQFQPSGNNNRMAQSAPYRRAPGGMPPAGEARFVPDQVLCVLQGNLTDPEIDRFLLQNRLARTASGAQRVGLLGAQVFRYRITDGRPVRTVIAALERDARVLSVQPNYIFLTGQGASAFSVEAAASVPSSAMELDRGDASALQSRSRGLSGLPSRPDAPQAAPTLKAAANSPAYATASEPTASETAATENAAKEAKPAVEPVAPVAAAPEPAAPAMSSMQYAITKLQVQQAHRMARGERVLVAVIDSRIDSAHPELDGAIVKQIDVLDDKDAKPHAHGTAMAGAIVAKSRLTGVAPGARVVAVRAFTGTSSGSASSTSYDLARAVDRAVTEGARVINLSFAGPQDPMLQQSLKSARDKGIVLIAAAGNAGPKSAPLYPAADPSVIAVTATDADDKVYKGANRGKYIAVAAPGVDILVPAPERNYELSTGTSVAAAHVSGVAALLLARNPSLNPDNVRQILTDSARSMGPKGQDEYGAGLTDAYKAVLTLDPSGTAQGPAASAAPTR